MRVLPDYKRSIYNVPHTMAKLLGFHSDKSLPGFSGVEVDTLVFILVDALGVNLLEMYGSPWEYEVITSVFPSTTSAALTTLYTGLSPREHGILEWYMYYEECGKVIKTLPFTHVNSQENDALLRECKPSLFNLPRLWDSIDVDMVAHVRKEYAHTSYTTAMFGEARIVPYGGLEDLLKNVRKNDARVQQIYIDYLDIAQHRFGVKSLEVRKELKEIISFVRALEDDGFSILLTADHGQMDVERRHILEVKNPDLVGGGPRDMFLYGEEEVEGYPILERRDFISLLGPGEENPMLRYRVPNLTVLPEYGEAVWYEEIEVKGLHGGLSEEEMLVPLIFLEGKI